MLNDNDSSMLLSSLSNYAMIEHDHAIQKACTENEHALFALLRPKIFIDGNKWCVLYGENIHEGVCGFGESPYLAVLDFNKSWHTKLLNQS